MEIFKKLPLVFFVGFFSFLFVLIRMKNVDQDYEYNNLIIEIEDKILENKELKAKKAKLLTVENLKKIGQKNSLMPPKEDQVIVID